MSEGEASSEVVVGPAAGNSSVQGVEGRLVDYTNQRLAVEGESEGDAEVGEAVDKVDSSKRGVSAFVNGRQLKRWGSEVGEWGRLTRQLGRR